ncbi:hypothetical protein N7522_012073 [Penicillium canescens]|nr:hypothetical protein N7522_012073 [Penicillium canescens]
MGPKYTPPPTPSPPASCYAMSDDDEDEYNTIAQASSRRGVKLLFSKSKVYVHPTSSAKDNIAGFIALIQQKPTPASHASQSKHPDAPSYLLAWVPESSLGEAYDTYVKVDLSDDSSPPRQKYLVPPLPTTTTYKDPIGLYAFAIPLSEIYSLLVRPPSLGWWFGSLVINTRAGDGFPALFFHDDECESTILQKKKRVRENFDPFDKEGSLFWGGDEVLRWLRRYVEVERSSVDRNVYLVNPSDEDQLSFGRSATHGDASLPGKAQPEAAAAGPSQAGPPDASMDPFMKTLKETRWKVLEQLSKITTFTRRTANDIAENPRIPPQMRRLMKNPEIQTLQDEFDSARVYLARWAMSVADQSEKDRNQRIWTAQDMLEMENSSVGDFEILELETGNLALQERRRVLKLEEWEGFFDSSSGRLQVTVDEVKERIFHGGLDPNDGVRKEAWLFLLEVYPWDSSREERQALMNSKRDEYIRLKAGWWERMVEGNSTVEQFDHWKEQRNRIEKDVHRTDRTIPLFAGEDIPHPDPDSPFAETGTNVHLEQMKDMLLTYNEFNPDLGYVQGMSDLLAPIYAVMQDDAVAFWAFVGFMDRMEHNFLRDQSGMRGQLLALDNLVQLMDPQLYLHLQSADSTNFFFFFRMLLVWYKREFDWSDVLRLWETLWTDYFSSSFHLFIALAILEKHRDVIMDHLKHFDEVLKYINELSNTMELVPLLTRAESLFHRFERSVQAIDKKDNFPAAPTAHQRRPGDQGSGDKGKSPGPAGSSSGVSAGPSSLQKAMNADKPKVISPELRQLLRKDIPWKRSAF